MKISSRSISCIYLKFFFLSIYLINSGYSYAQLPAKGGGRTIVSLNENWKFIKDPERKYSQVLKEDLQWERVSLPHTWNVRDVMDDRPGYYRGIGWYKKTIRLSPELKGKNLFLYFEGVNQQAEVYVNGKKAGTHLGGYTRFCVPVSRFLNFDDKDSANEIVIKADNSHNDNIPPLSADFTFFGGIYRNLYLIATNPVSFDLTDYSSNGVYIQTPQVSELNASVSVRSRIFNSGAVSRKLTVRTFVNDREGKQVAVTSETVRFNGNEKTEISQQIRNIKSPHLWSPDDPYMYTVISRIYDVRDNRLLDEVVNPLGFRWFKFDPEKGFFLNGKPCKLIGTSRHQDYQDLGNALPDELHIRDMKLLKEMGGNFLRVAHYPQDPRVLEMCDRLGLLASVEIPVVNAITESEEFYQNCREMQKEMIRQNFNHPSVILWAYMNEVLLKPKFENDKPRQEEYFANITKLAQNLEDLIRKEDPSRYTFMSNHGAYDHYKRIGLTSIPMVVGWNLYQGWYSDKIEGFGEFLDRFHKENPDKPMMITEYGADADPRLRSFNFVRFDKTVEYAGMYHEVYLNEILKRPFVAGAAAWNLADFNSEQREETMPHINNKGLLNWDRSPKDIYYFYQASLLKKPFIKIASGVWNFRAGIAGEGANTCLQPVKVYTNLQAVRLFVNGKDLGVKGVKDHSCEWIVPFTEGRNLLEAVSAPDAGAKDFAEIEFNLLPGNFKSDGIPFSGLNVLLGSQRYFIDRLTHEVWVPDRPYMEGGWGSVGGTPFRLKNGNKDGYGSDRNIAGTENDPVYQTQQVGIREYRMDVPDGQYAIALYFAELTGGKVKPPLPYNLGGMPPEKVDTVRVFDVTVNGSLLLDHLNLSAEEGIDNGIIKKTVVYAEGGKGIRILFSPVEGEPVLNALQVRRLW